MMDTQSQPQTNEADPSTRSKAIVIGLAGLLGTIVIAGVLVVAAQTIGSGTGWTVEPGQPVEISIETGSSASGIYSELEDAQVAQATELHTEASRLAASDRLQAGTYSFVTAMDPEAVIRQLVQGPNTDLGNTFTVIEGWTVDRILTELALATGYTQADFQLVMEEGRITSPYLPTDQTVDPVTAWEGLLFAAKYPIAEDASPEVILGAMADEFISRMDRINWSRLEGLGVSKREAIVIASLIQREAGTDDERRMIASVIYNRIAQDMRLQIDATVVYALGYNPGRVLSAHLAVESPYNTYRVDGLPPTPIGSVSMASLEAAADPANTTYLFYVLGNEDGSHLFADTYVGHQNNIAVARETGVLP